MKQFDNYTVKVISCYVSYVEEIEKKLYCDDVTLINYIYSW